jgi:molecular chaperone GrpE (heat shock protein)
MTMSEAIEERNKMQAAAAEPNSEANVVSSLKSEIASLKGKLSIVESEMTNLKSEYAKNTEMILAAVTSLRTDAFRSRHLE